MKNEVLNNEAFNELYKRMKDTFETSNKPIPNNMRHPKLVKLEELILEHFRNKIEGKLMKILFGDSIELLLFLNKKRIHE
jgi:ERCC4-related helicase